MPHKELLDPQGKAVNETLGKLNFTGIHDVRIGKHIQIHVHASDEQNAYAIVEEACKKMLYNQVMEQYEIQILTL
jgi:phosphoribosylformylglycinamidine synthase